MITTSLRTLLLSQVAITNRTGTRIFVTKADQNTASPYIVITRISHDPLKALDGTTGLRFTDVDIDCCATDYPTAVAVADAVREFLKDYSGSAGNETINAVLLNDEDDDFIIAGDGRDAGYHMVTLDFQIQHTPL